MPSVGPPPDAPPGERGSALALGHVENGVVGVAFRWLDGVRALVEHVDGDDPVDDQELGRRAPTRVLLLDPEDSDAGPREREVVVDGWSIRLAVEPERRAALRERASRGRGGTASGGPTDIRAAIPGQVLAVAVAAGDEVSAGQELLVVEAMKMQNEVRAPRAGTVRSVEAVPGRTIELGDLLVVLE